MYWTFISEPSLCAQVSHGLLETPLSAQSQSHITASVQIMTDSQTLYTFIKVPQMNNLWFQVSVLQIFNFSALGLVQHFLVFISEKGKKKILVTENKDSCDKNSVHDELAATYRS